MTADAPAPTMRANVGRDLIAVLRAYGIDTVFGIPGTHNLEFYRHLPEFGIRPVTTRHEQGAGFAADGWSQQTGLPGVVITTSGPGLLNVLSAAATAYAESRPLVVLTPGPARGAEFADVGGLHETKDTRGAAAAVVEWARRVESGTAAVEAVHDAFELFRTGRPRPVVIEVPLDVLEGASDCPATGLESRPAPDSRGAEQAEVERAAEVLAAARRPVILAGGGSVAATESLRALAERLDAPVITSLNGRGVLPESHPLSVGAALRFHAGHALVNEADVVVVVGSKVGESELWWGPLQPTGTVLRVDRLASQIDTNLTAQIGLVGDSVAVLAQLLTVVPPVEGRPVEKSPFARPDRGSDRVAATRERCDLEGRALGPASCAVADAVAAAVGADVIIGADSSQVSYLGTANLVPVERPHSYLFMGTYATLGYGLPASIGAKLASPDRPVVCVVGDGALMFSVQELITAVEQDIDLVVVCVDNGGYREIEENEIERGIAPIAVRLTQPDWAALADAFGGTGTRVASAADLTPALRTALAAGGVQLLHVPLALFEESGLNSA